MMASEMAASNYIPRLVDDLLDEYLAQAPGILVTGSRAIGKTTTIGRRAASVAKLEVPEVAAAFRIDPDAAFAAMDEPVLIDEWQVVPEVVGAIRRAIDRDPSPGRFLITGSAASELDSDLWPATGRLIRLPMHPMTVTEMQGRTGDKSFFDRLESDLNGALVAGSTQLSDYVDLALAGGYPLPALQMRGRVRDDWFESYVQ